VTKQQIALSPQRHFRGYQSLGANVTRFDGGFARDYHEGIDFYKDVTVCLASSRGLAQNSADERYPYL
jgi:hypothetical protein